MSRFFLLASSDQGEINDFLNDLPGDTDFVTALFHENSDHPFLLFSAPSVVTAELTTSPTTEPVNPGWHVGQRVKAVAGKSHLIGQTGEVRAVFLSEESDDDDQTARDDIEAKMDGRPFPQVVVKFDGNSRRVRYSGADDLQKLQVVA